MLLPLTIETMLSSHLNAIQGMVQVLYCTVILQGGWAVLLSLLILELKLVIKSWKNI